jgi:hypothetical protein
VLVGQGMVRMAPILASYGSLVPTFGVRREPKPTMKAVYQRVSFTWKGYGI